MRDEDFASALARIEQRQAAYEIVAHRLIGMLEVEPGPSPTTEVLNQILATMQRQTELLEGLPEAISETIRDEMQREFEEELEVKMEPAEGAFDRRDEDAP